MTRADMQGPGRSQDEFRGRQSAAGPAPLPRAQRSACIRASALRRAKVACVQVRAIGHLKSHYERSHLAGFSADFIENK